MTLSPKFGLTLAALAALGLAAAHPAAAQTTLFSDNFNSPDSTVAQGGINAGVSTAGRQSGADVPAAGLTYQQKGDPSNQAAILNHQFSSASGVSAYATPNHDFLTDFAGTGKPASLTFSLQFTTSDAFAFFDLSDTPLTFGNAGNSFGIIFKPGANNSNVFVGSLGGTDNGTAPSFTYNPLANGLNDLSVTFNANAAGTADTISVLLDGTPISASNTGTAGTFLFGQGGNGIALTNAYLTFGAEFKTPATFDNVSVVANNLSAAPEPSAFAGLALGGLSLAGLMFKARKRQTVA